MLATVLHRTHGYTGEMILGDGTALEFVNGQAGPTTITFADAQSLTVMGFAVVTTDTPSTGYDLFTDQIVAPIVTSAASDTSAALRADFVPKWTASTAYLANDIVLSPAGAIVQAKANFTSGASFSLSNWNVLSAAGGTLTYGLAAARPDPTTAPDGSVYVSTDVSGGKAQQVQSGAWVSIAAPYRHGNTQHLPWESDPIALNADLGLPVFTVPQIGSSASISNSQPYLYGDGTHDDAPAINYAIQQANAAGGGIVMLPVGTWYAFSTIFLGFLPSAVPSSWTTANTPTALADGQTLPGTFTARSNVTLAGGGMNATKIIRKFDGVLLDVSGVAGTNNSIGNFARRCNLRDLNLYGGISLGLTTLQPVLRHYYATVCETQRVNVLDGSGEGWRIVQSWDSMAYHNRVDNCGGNQSGTFGGTTYTPNSTPTYPAVHILSQAPGSTSGQFGYATDTTNNWKFRDLTIESYRDGALWIDGSGGFWNGVNGLTFTDLKCDSTGVNGPAIQITAGVGGNNNQQRANYNLHINGLVVSQGNTLYTGNTGPWDAITVQDTRGLIIADAIITPQSAANGPPLKNCITFTGNNLGALLHNVGRSGSTLVTGTPTYPLSLLNFASGQNDVSATAWGALDKAGGQLPLMVGTPTTGLLPPPFYGGFGGNGTSELTGTEYGGLTMWAPSGGGGVGLAVSGDTVARFRTRPDGTHEWGSGSAARDAFVTRVAAGVLNVANALSVTGLTGATSGARFVGATASGAPASGTFATGDYVIARNGHVWICTAGGTQGTWVDASSGGAGSLAALSDVTLTSLSDGQGLVYQASSSKWINQTLSGSGNVSTDASGHIPIAQMPATARAFSLVKRTGAVAETFTRLGTVLGSNTLFATGQLHFTALPLVKGTVVNTITFFSATAAVTPTNQWFALYDSGFNKLAVTNDDTTTAWAATAEKTLTLSSPYTVTADALFYVGVMVAATTVPNLASANSVATAVQLAPVLGFKGQSGLTTPSSAPTTATVTASAAMAYAWVA